LAVYLHRNALKPEKKKKERKEKKKKKKISFELGKVWLTDIVKAPSKC